MHEFTVEHLALEQYSGGNKWLFELVRIAYNSDYVCMLF